jgi:hypothetical protein
MHRKAREKRVKMELAKTKSETSLEQEAGNLNIVQQRMSKLSISRALLSRTLEPPNSSLTILMLRTVRASILAR